MQRAQLDHIISQVLDFAGDTSDILFTAGKPVQAEVHGELYDVPLRPKLGKLLPFQTESIAMSLMGRSTRLYRDHVDRGSCDLSYAVAGKGRFRVNVFSQRGTMAVVMRRLPDSIPSFKELGLPDVFKEIVHEKYGLVLVTGATGTGKTTSLASLIDAINSRHRKHVITLEDPVEYRHHHKEGTVNQRELGEDFDTFASGLRSALRQAPKVILVGELRDRETVTIALEAAETGHLVLGTLHTADTGQTINRIIGMFELNEERLVRGRLGESLKYVISQRLMPKIGVGRVACFEVMRNNLRIRELILNGESEEKTFYGVVETSSAFNMFTFDQHLADLFQKGIITAETAMLNASDKSKLGKTIDRIKSERGEKVTDIGQLEVDWDYEKG